MEQKQALLVKLNRNRKHLTRQQVRTIRGQIFSGDLAGAERGMERLLCKKQKQDISGT